jgi:hypothetical protein
MSTILKVLLGYSKFQRKIFKSSEEMKFSPSKLALRELI